MVLWFYVIHSHEFDITVISTETWFWERDGGRLKRLLTRRSTDKVANKYVYRTQLSKLIQLIYLMLSASIISLKQCSLPGRLPACGYGVVFVLLRCDLLLMMNMFDVKISAGYSPTNDKRIDKYPSAIVNNLIGLNVFY